MPKKQVARNWIVWIGPVVGVVALGFTAQAFFFGTATSTKIGDIKGCNGFLVKDKPELLSKKAISDEVEKKYLQDKIQTCRDELQKNDKNAVALTNIGEAYRRLGDLPTALIDQQEALKLDPNLQEAKLGLGLVQTDMGKTAEANKTIQDTLTQKVSPIAYFYQGVTFYQQKDWKSAEASFRRAIGLDPNLAEAYSNLGVALNEQGKVAEAINAYQKAISLNPNDARAYSNLGNALYKQGKIVEAITAYQKAINLNPKYAEAYSNLGNSLTEQDKRTEAITALQKAISLNPNLSEPYYNLGNSLRDQGKVAEAITAYQKAISLNPKFAEAYTNLGNALGEQGKLAEAITAHQKAISLNPTFAEAYSNLGVALYKQGNLKGAIASFKEARDLFRSQGKTQIADKINQALEDLGNR